MADVVIILLNNSNMMLASSFANGCKTVASRQAALRFNTSMQLLRVGVPTQRLYMNALQRNHLGQRLALSQFVSKRGFSDSAVVSQQDARDELDMSDENTRLGVDTEFSAQKHAYVLTFPWNFDEIIEDFQGRHKPLSGGYWATYAKNSGAFTEFNNLFREFHQSCALHDKEGIEKICEGKLAQAINESLDRIHFHGLDMEMANLTVESNIQVLKVEVSYGISLERAQNGNAEDWIKNESTLLGAPCTYYTPVEDKRDILDGLAVEHKPYNVAITALIDSPMKLFVQN